LYNRPEVAAVPSGLSPTPLIIIIIIIIMDDRRKHWQGKTEALREKPVPSDTLPTTNPI
jgi:hypothetical protein